MTSERPRVRNALLSSMTDADFAKLSPSLELVDLEVRKMLHTPSRDTEFVYFPEAGIASVLAVGGDRSRIEVALVGREGCTGQHVALGGERAVHEIFVQVPGEGYRLPVGEFSAALDDSRSLRSMMLRYVQTFIVQLSSTALSNGRQTLEGRLARWLLMCSDRVDGHELLLTHEFIASMLGVRRPGVTLAVQMLEGRGLIRATRSRILIADRTGLIQSAEGFYGNVEAEYARLLG